MAAPAAAPTPSHPAPRRSPFGAALARRHNPLWRRTDTLRDRLRVLLVLALTATAAVSVLLALGLYQHDRAHALRYAATLHRTQAVALSDADQQSGGLGADFTALVRWTGPTGAERQARAAADPGTVTGDRVTVWLDRAGQVAAPPTSAADSSGRATLLGCLALTGGGALVLAGSALTRTCLNRVDLRNWDRAWAAAEPAWTGRK
ncbi:hypothetical protein ACEZDB_16015 [Streptacidiphilus sp. N1-3]|uniref:Integral membrane protein n=1 Tax=Streptacidiphilus alkalitolerans TaxID=3342712 RepID=A0ABV6X1L2_9ACTN